MDKNIISHDFLKLQYPDISLARSFNFPIEGILYDSVRMVFDIFVDRNTINEKTNFPVAYNQTFQSLQNSINLFDRFSADFDLNAQEHNIALSSWMCHRLIDTVDIVYWDILGQEVMSILAYMEKDENFFPQISFAKGDKTLALTIGLDILTDLNFKTNQYKAGQSNMDWEVDQYYAFKVLNDTPLMNTCLEYACREKAKEFIDILRKRKGRSFDIL